MNKPTKKGGGKQTATLNGNADLHRTRIDLPARARTQIIERLNQSLADTLDLKTQVKQAHWNVKGQHFYQLHLLFDEIAGELEEYTDMVAERITALAGTALGTCRMAAAASRLPEYPHNLADGIDLVAALSDRLSMYGKTLRENIEDCALLEDAGTADLFTEMSRNIDKRLWFLEAHLQG